MKNFADIMRTYGADAEENYTSFEVVDDNYICLTAKDIQSVHQCCLRTVEYDGKSCQKLLITAKVSGSAKPKTVWAKLDGDSHKLYEDAGNASIDPSRIALYELRDPDKKYGREDKNFTWLMVCIDTEAVMVKEKKSPFQRKPVTKAKPVRKSAKKSDEVPF